LIIFCDNIIAPEKQKTENRKPKLAMRLPRQLEALARLLTYVLCRRPDEFGLVLSDEGFVSIKALLQALAVEPGWGFVRRRHLEEIAALGQPPAVEIQGDLIRGLIPGPARLRHSEVAPPTLLYYSISPKAHARVWEEGLQAPGGQELVLAATPEMARKLGKRRGAGLLVTVQARAAARRGVVFQGYGDSLFLAAAVPREFLQLPAPEVGEVAKPAKPPPLPGTVVMDLPQFFREAAKVKGKFKGEAAWKTGARTARRKKREP
jgi:putative RNA 2'-phosphotransferase